MLTVESLSYTYNFGTPFQAEALRDVSFQAGAGEVIGVIGPGGSGKSCLFRCIAGVLSPESGRIVKKISGRGFATEVGLVIQEPEQQFFMENVLEEVGFALANRGLPSAAITGRVKTVLQSLGYTGELRQSPFRLSGGQQRRVALAGILVMAPAILLLDEPTVGLDAGGLLSVKDLINEYRRKKGIVLIISHDYDFLAETVDRFLVLNGGRLRADFKKSEYQRHLVALEAMGIGAPETVRLLARGVPDFMAMTLDRLDLNHE